MAELDHPQNLSSATRKEREKEEALSFFLSFFLSGKQHGARSRTRDDGVGETRCCYNDDHEKKEEEEEEEEDHASERSKERKRGEENESEEESEEERKKRNSEREVETADARKRRIKDENMAIARAQLVKEKVRLLMQKANAPTKGEQKRKATHWSYVTTEMKWLARDFAAERDWKLEAARQVALTAGVANGMPVGRERTKKPERRKSGQAGGETSERILGDSLGRGEEG